MAVTKPLAAALVLLAACESPGRGSMRDAPSHDGTYEDAAEIWIPPDAAPPPFDAAPLPAMACTSESDAGGQCTLPPSHCLDSHYLIYYTGGSCVDDTCSFETRWLYCPYYCSEYGAPPVAGCDGGFT